ncbi:hypothetical protein [Streptomyces graminilatus]|uniref:hypothetical protein n=1 Tax=Streptomyces graminilatus TaxID=1464070 RepID=UPI0006E38688|nr:hypothetical protein [Streptomyces graminilatus]
MACILSAALLVGGWEGDPPGVDVVSPDDFGVGTALDECSDIGPDRVPEIPDLPDGGGLIPDDPDENSTVYGSYVPYDPCEGFGE